MPKEDIFKCPACLLLYDDNKLQLQCGHCVCSICSATLGACPICDKILDGPRIRSGDEYREIMRNIRNEIDIRDFLIQLDAEENADRIPGYCKECNQPADNLSVCTVCPLEADLFITANNVWYLNCPPSDETKAFLKLKTHGMCMNCANGSPNHHGHGTLELKQVKFFGMKKYFLNYANTLMEVAEKNNLEEMEGYPHWRFLFHIRNFAFRINVNTYLWERLELDRENPAGDARMIELQQENRRLARIAEHLDGYIKKRRVQFGLDITNKARGLIRGEFPEILFGEIERILRDVVQIELERGYIEDINRRVEEKSMELANFPVRFEWSIIEQEAVFLRGKEELNRLSDEHLQLTKELACAGENLALAEEKQAAIEANLQETIPKKNVNTNLFIEYTLCKLAVLEKKIRKLPELTEAEIRSVIRG